MACSLVYAVVHMALGFPQVDQRGPFRICIFAEPNEPAHVHVYAGRPGPRTPEAKFWITDGVRLCWSHGMSASELRKATKFVEDRQEFLLEEWRQRVLEA